MWWGIWGEPEVAYGGEETRGGVHQAVLGGVDGREVKKVRSRAKWASTFDVAPGN